MNEIPHFPALRDHRPRAQYPADEPVHALQHRSPLIDAQAVLERRMPPRARVGAILGETVRSRLAAGMDLSRRGPGWAWKRKRYTGFRRPRRRRSIHRCRGRGPRPGISPVSTHCRDRRDRPRHSRFFVSTSENRGSEAVTRADYGTTTEGRIPAHQNLTALTPAARAVVTAWATIRRPLRPIPLSRCATALPEALSR